MFTKSKLHYRYFIKRTLLSSLVYFSFLLISGCQPPIKSDSTLTIGFVEINQYRKENYEELRKYLETQLRKKYGDVVQVKLDSLPVKSVTDIEEKITDKKWDVAFTLRPMYSILAKTNNYQFVARMFPEVKNGYFDVAFFVKSGSPIHDINDLKSDSTIALGDYGNDALFIMPIYDLFGRAIRVSQGNSAQDIIEKVKSGEADIGIGYTSLLQQDKDLRILNTSRVMPVGGLYISPEIKNPQDRDFITNILLDAPIDIQEKTNYIRGSELNYEMFRGIAQRADQILKCVDFTHNPVYLYCSKTSMSSSTPYLSWDRIEGIVDGVESNQDRAINLKIQDQGKTYLVILPQDMLQKIPYAPPIEQLNRTRIRVMNVRPTPGIGGLEKLQITKPEQLKFFK